MLKWVLAQEHRESGWITTYKILQAHANSTYRVKCTLEKCPAAAIALGVIAQALRRTGAVKWVATRMVNKLQTADLVTALACLRFHRRALLGSTKRGSWHTVFRADERVLLQFSPLCGAVSIRDAGRRRSSAGYSPTRRQGSSALYRGSHLPVRSTGLP